jgi:long-chain acyl-CoA synthetase
VDVERPAPHELLAALLRAAAGDAAPVAVLDPSWPSGLRAAADRQLARAVQDGRLGAGDLVLFTSGSGGRPRGVVRTARSWTASLDPLAEVTGATGQDVVWLPGPLTSSLTLYGGFAASVAGARVVHGSPTPDVTTAHLVPTALADALDRAAAGGLPRLRSVVVAGATLPSALRQRAQSQGWRVVEYYGAAELSFVGWRDGDGPFRDFPGARVRLHDGLLWSDSPYLAGGYLDPTDPGPLRWDGPWATVADAGRRVPGGWVVTGRADAAVTTGGHTVLVEEVEAFVGAQPGVREVAVVGWPHPRLGEVVVAVVVVQEVSGGSALPSVTGAAALSRACRDLPPAARPRRWLTAPSLPRTSAGKVDRAALAGRLTGLPPLP